MGNSEQMTSSNVSYNLNREIQVILCFKKSFKVQRIKKKVKYGQILWGEVFGSYLGNYVLKPKYNDHHTKLGVLKNKVICFILLENIF